MSLPARSASLLLQALQAAACRAGLASLPSRALESSSATTAHHAAARALSTSWPSSMAHAQPEPKKQAEASSSSSSSAAAEGAQAAAGSAGSGGGGREGPSASTSSADPRVEEVTQKVFEGFKAGYENMRAKMDEAKTSSSASASQRSQLLQEAAKEMQAVFRASPGIRSATRMYTGPVAEEGAQGQGEGPSALVVTKQKQSTWDKIHEKLEHVPLFSRLGAIKKTAAYRKTKEMYDDLRDKYETTDHPAVHKIEDIKERLSSGGSEASRAMREIRTRDPGFDLNDFVRAIKLDAPVVAKAFLNRDLSTLKLHCGPELLERFSGIFKHHQQEGEFADPTILFVGDVELVEVKLADDDPFAIVQFHCQQIQCTRDKFGNIIDGSTDSIQRVYYFWGIQQEKQGVITAEGQLLPPRWVIRDMMWQSMLALV